MSPQNPAVEPGVKPLHWALRLNLLIASVLPLTAGFSLFVLTSETDSYSAWTIDSAITAAAIGAAYWAGFFLPFLAGLERTWAAARVAIPPVIAFTAINLIAAIVDFGKFHTDADVDGFGTLLLSWGWVLTCAGGFGLLVFVIVLQLRLPGGDPPSGPPLEGPIRTVLVLQALVLGGIGAALFVAPVDVANEIWPWELTPLNGRVMSAWLIALAVGAVAVLRENDWTRSRPTAIGYTLFGALEIVVLLRYTDDVDFGSARLLIYLAFLVSIVVVGAYGWRKAGREQTAEPALAT